MCFLNYSLLNYLNIKRLIEECCDDLDYSTIQKWGYILCTITIVDVNKVSGGLVKVGKWVGRLCVY